MQCRFVTEIPFAPDGIAFLSFSGRQISEEFKKTVSIIAGKVLSLKSNNLRNKLKIKRGRWGGGGSTKRSGKMVLVL